ncbi:Heavy metal-associated isoprenylated plant protein [Thalictrum thalictroides]|uniref:Heavy metal-associated isoprenylated plant protein n=1 Tax=Thalictrum thalictroides TaxID=46969 RepID=A0A7J6WRS3_THATH|nr:Heavy metal-associated isoprenylated plant protein [Thalictrum thalictroides]
MGQILAKICEFIITNITCRFSSRGNIYRSQPTLDSSSIHTQEVEEERERLITIQDSHIITIPREDEDHDQLMSRLIITNEIVDEQGLVIEIPDDYHTVSTNLRENDNGSKGSLEQNSQSSLVSTDPTLKLVDNVAVQKEDVGGQQKKKKKRASKKKKDKSIKHYCSSHDILLVGEGDFSFSVCLSKAFGSASKMIATSLDSENRLKEYYEDAMSNINHLKNNGCTILHEVDATVMASHPVLSGLKFDRIIYNFPLVGFINESKRTQLKRNRNLVLKFMKNAKELMKEDGEIHITHKSSTSYREWNLENLAKQNRLKLIEEVEFRLWHYPGYNNKYGFGGNENFECYPSKTYKFGLKDVVAGNVVSEANQDNPSIADYNKPKASPQKNALEINSFHLLAKEGDGTLEMIVPEDESSSSKIITVSPSLGVGNAGGALTEPLVDLELQCLASKVEQGEWRRLFSH